MEFTKKVSRLKLANYWLLCTRCFIVCYLKNLISRMKIICGTEKKRGKVWRMCVCVCLLFTVDTWLASECRKNKGETKLEIILWCGRRRYEGVGRRRFGEIFIKAFSVKWILLFTQAFHSAQLLWFLTNLSFIQFWLLFAMRF